MYVANEAQNLFLTCKQISVEFSELPETELKIAKVALGVFLISSFLGGVTLLQFTCTFSIIGLTCYAANKISDLFTYYCICIDLPETMRSEVVKYASQLFHDIMSLEDKTKIIAFINLLDPSDRADIIHNFLKLKVKYRPDAIVSILTEIAAISKADRACVTKNVLKLIGHEMTIKEITNLLKNIAAIPFDERSSLVDLFPGFALMNKISKSTNPLLEFYLIPENLRSIEILELIDNEAQYLKVILDSCDQKLSNPEMPKVTLYEIANFVCNHYQAFGLDVEGDLVKKAAELYSTPEKEMPGAIGLYGKLLNLAKIAPNFQPQATKIDELNGYIVSVNMAQIRAISNERIKREDLPADATVENWNQIVNEFLNKIQNNHKIIDSLASHLQHTDFNVSEFVSSIKMTTVSDGENFLIKLLESTSLVPSNAEAKFKKIVSYIWNRNHYPRINNDFTEREEAFIIAMTLIKHCSQGKTQGIDAYYNTFDEKDKYSMKLATPKTVTEKLEEDDRIESINYVKSWLRSNSEEKKQSVPDKFLNLLNSSWGQGKAIQNAELPLKKKVALLKNFAIKDTRESSEKLKGLADNEEFYDISDDDFQYALNVKGAEKVLKLFDQYQAKEFVLAFVTQVVRKFIDNHFTGSGFLMQELTGETVVSQPPHQLPYLKNLIGVHLGTTHEIIFDQYTGCISYTMLQRSREEILDIFFKHASPNSMVKDLIQEVNAEIDISKNASKLFLDFLSEDEFWTKKMIAVDSLWQTNIIEKRVLNPRGAIELLKAFGLITLTKTDL